ncbi:CPBP family intramembrane glutamic endopeptidase [Mannheimia granulomatis]|uniref:CPBP family intramembrane glutamic endopeptidase n=1 Tax=Mannheimia granulomatis TaxID=85402 RepID=UPI00047D6083|nr:CPBP family intramembrane glutamic endopeptidase [Mannheimia granulomatis]QLB19697.1 hypothetical protein A6B41_09680 [Mannheimia granulomatis]
MSSSKIKNLNFIDIVVLAVIFFGTAVVSSLMDYYQLRQFGLVGPENLSINDMATYSAIITEAVLLILAGIYLHWRKFDFRVLDFTINRYTLPYTLLLVLSAGLVADIYQYLHAFIIPEHYPETAYAAPIIRYTPELILTSLFNGFFEEIFFMGLVFVAKPKILPKALAFSIFVRFIFHTYQGLAGALTITTLGLSFWFFRRRINMLVPFCLAHAVFDIFGLSTLRFLFLGEN